MSEDARFKQVADEIAAKLSELQMSYDTKVLATSLLVRGAQLLAGCRAAGVWTQEDVVNILVGINGVALEPPETVPTVMILDPTVGVTHKH